MAVMWLVSELRSSHRIFTGPDGAAIWQVEPEAPSKFHLSVGDGAT